VNNSKRVAKKNNEELPNPETAMNAIRTTLAALALSLFAASMANAQLTPTNATPSGGLTLEKLGETLDLLGFDYQATKNPEGRVVGYKVQVERDGHRHSVFIEFNRDNSIIWVQAMLRELKSEDRADGSRLFKLLELNDKIGPCHFFVTGGGKVLAMGLARDNKSVTAKDLRRQIDLLLGCALALENEWNPGKSNMPAPAPSPIRVPLEDM
jgi:hypothetical protein